MTTEDRSLPGCCKVWGINFKKPVWIALMQLFDLRISPGQSVVKQKVVTIKRISNCSFLLFWNEVQLIDFLFYFQIQQWKTAASLTRFWFGTICSARLLGKESFVMYLVLSYICHKPCWLHCVLIWFSTLIFILKF